MDILLLALRVLLVILLYGFLATILLMLWRDLRQSVSGRETARPKGQLIVLQTADETLAVDTPFSLQPVTSIGRAPDNTISISDTYISAQHALLTWREGQWWLEDLGSRNRTLLNGTPVTTPTVVSAGDVIGVGRVQMKLVIGD